MAKITSLDLPTSHEALENAQAELPEGCQPENLMTGLMKWTNPINRFTVIRLHRTADPAKRSREYVDRVKANMTISDFLREYELHWESLEGKPVYQEEFSREFHVSKSPLGWNPHLPVARGWDFGLYPACLFAQLLSGGRLIVLREAIGIDIDTERFTDEIAALSQQWFPDATFYEFVDPTGTNRAGTDGRSYTQLLSRKPLSAKRITRGANAPAQRKRAVIDFLKANVKGVPCFLIDPSCEYLIKGFDGGYMYAYKKGTLREKPEKNIFSHIHDATQYLCSRIRTVEMSLTKPIGKPLEPRYGNRAPQPLPATSSVISGGMYGSKQTAA